MEVSNSTTSLVGYDHLVANVDNPEPQAEMPTLYNNGDKYVIALVGLPATGKTYLARRLSQYLQFFHGSDTKVFNVGNYRRKLVGAKSPHTFFDPSNEEFVKLRDQCAQEAMDDLIKWLEGSDFRSRVAIYDATNTTRQRRTWICDQLKTSLESVHKVIFVESVIRNEELVEGNVRETKLSMPDYEGMDPDEAVTDFMQRIEHYRSAYEPITEENSEDRSLSWIKMIDAGRSISMNHISGFLPGRIVQFLMNLHTTPRTIYLSRHGQSQYNVLGKIGGDSQLSESGEQYAKELAKFVHTEILGLDEDGNFKDPENRVVPHARLFTSSLRRTQLTARHIVHHKCDDGWIVMRPRICSSLSEIHAGAFDGFTYKEIEEKAPEEFKRRSDDKLGYRYPRGESYLDVIARLDPIIHEVERQRDPILIVGHQGILRIIYAYFVGDTRENAPFVSIPLNTVIKLTPRTYSCDVERFSLNKGHSASDGDHEPPSH
ncbi:6-phosphofructo-2-kinase/fructose-2,6-bisphosphatase [Hondaea fermentalgiana]|uniref:6-phosphofructo-2-kinase/fructose-2,6-bisphosphatase n=1 Tax=Hondaea fermentalgiana TaxID=2315210 RepID=A0A2R5GW11_9STRA|nr:6-phosphofructo-2-kinase/fructose-2,6-bisphosphatase [Hondaea fermentalgiana]|eukprot:GBG35017.1 6-phosphofructo-2-kinase/fructose-2,6-bisphosphatase [Hondaea fermentalgiana]